ncbi:MAG TPA: peptide chain release factor N(5)-glutamine methyltransferase [Terracidiphilus sp.]|nr:peptide chain release factor N(5)-glutamine methyltransferase [Terracidiphilus sp.]
MPSIAECIARAAECLSNGPHPERARRDAETLLSAVLKKNKAWLLAHAGEELPEPAGPVFAQGIERRASGEPVQYILGETEFYGMPFRVTREVLIPRPETEHVVEKATELARQFAAPRIVDVGTGSGAIAIALAHNRRDAAMTATDVSAAALAVARSNAKRNGVAERARFLEGDLLEPVAGEQFEMVVSNPPYVAERDRESLSVEVRDFEPAEALFAGEDGLAVYRRLIPAAHAALVTGGWIVLEIGYGQEANVRELLRAAGFEAIESVADLQGIARVVCAARG